MVFKLGVPQKPHFQRLPQRWPRVLVLDTVGVIVDKYSLGPTLCMQRAAKALGIFIPSRDIMPFLGLGKKQHLIQIMANPIYRNHFTSTHNRRFDETKDIDIFLKHFETEQLKLHDRYASFCELIPEFSSMLRSLRSTNPDMLILQTSGFTEPIMKDLQHRLVIQGFIPNAIVCSSDMANRSDMITAGLKSLDVNAKDALFIGDQPKDLEAAHIACVYKKIAITHSVPKQLFPNQFTNAKCNSLLEIPTLVERWAKEMSVEEDQDWK